VQAIAEVYREQEMVQAIHRIRPVLAGSNRKRIVILSSLPLRDVPPTHLFGLEDVCPSLRPKTTYGLMSRVFDKIDAAFGGVAMPVVDRVLADIHDGGGFSKGPLGELLKRLSNNPDDGFHGLGVTKRTVENWLATWAAGRGSATVDVPRLERDGDGGLRTARGRPMKAHIPDYDRREAVAIVDGLARYLATGELPQHPVVPSAEPADVDSGGVLGFLYDSVPDDYFEGKASLARTRRIQEAIGLIDPRLGNAIRDKLRWRWKLRRAS
jgi:hypothetical protein